MAQHRAPKGEVSVYATAGFLRLNCTYKGQRLRRALGLQDIPVNRAIAQKVAAEASLDLALGQFDPTWKKYLGKKSSGAGSEKTAELFERWVKVQKAQGVAASSLRGRYNPLLSNLKLWGKEIHHQEQAQKYLNWQAGRVSVLVCNSYLRLLQKFGEWAVEQGDLDTNPFAEIRNLRGGKKISDAEPFSIEEIEAILTFAESHENFAHYRDLIEFLFCTGTRAGEAVALRWGKVDLDKGLVTIDEALSRASGKMVRKAPKTGAKGCRTLAMDDRLKSMLRGRRPGYAHPNRPVFPGKRGGAVNVQNLNRIWRPILEGAGVPYRKLHATRMTAASLAINSGASITQVQRMLGHSSPRMLLDHYAKPMGNPASVSLGQQRPKVVELRQEVTP